MKLYQQEASPYCREIRWVLDRKGLDYQPIEPDANTSPEPASLHQTDELP